MQLINNVFYYCISDIETILLQMWKCEFFNVLNSEKSHLVIFRWNDDFDI